MMGQAKETLTMKTINLESARSVLDAVCAATGLSELTVVFTATVLATALFATWGSKHLF